VGGGSEKGRGGVLAKLLRAKKKEKSQVLKKRLLFPKREKKKSVPHSPVAGKIHFSKLGRAIISPSGGALVAFRRMKRVKYKDAKMERVLHPKGRKSG